MSAMSASPPLVLPLSLIAEHKVAGNKPPASTPQQVAPLPPVAATPPVSVTPSPSVVVTQPQTNGMEPAQSPPTPAVAPAVPPPPVPATPPQPTTNTAPIIAQGVSQAEGGAVAPGSGTSVSAPNREVEGKSAVSDVSPTDAQSTVAPVSTATVSAGEQNRQDAPASAPQHQVAPAAASLPTTALASAPTPVVESPAVPPPGPTPTTVQSLPPPSVETSPPVPVSTALPPITPSAPPPSTPTPPLQENAKPPRSLKRKLQPAEGEVSKKTPKVGEPPSPIDDGRKSKRTRQPTQPYQSPIPELNMIAKMNNTPKALEEKLIVFYRNEFLAVRNAEGGFYVCQAMQNIYRSAPGHRSKIKIRWFTQSPNDVFTPDFYDSTEFDCILTNLNLDRMEKDVYKLPAIEKQRTESILKRAIDAEKGIAQPSDSALTEEHPDGLDLSLYRHEDQLKKRRKKKDSSSKKKAKAGKAPAEVKKPTRTSTRSSSGTAEESIVKDKGAKANEKLKSRTSKKRKIGKKNDKSPKKKEPEVANNKKEVENSGRKSANSGPAVPAVRKTSDKTKSAVAAKAASKAPPGAASAVTKQSSAPRQTRVATPKQ